ncbi:hypothetical protein HER10_EVM0003842 [Colletotrichum scovillei]|uniref:uncharacterized protein n=1 Tax=Colletotrichum scovillei TaxID=1209932 RepID=UPI0015C3ADC2|nr:uncharacterized protein HER10_EVM0003842 [Colletotrichum scovillei]KAF4780876.1 hypothetical protein HER10_EVM0003842 [Colletotrichum scovillei]
MLIATFRRLRTDLSPRPPIMRPKKKSGTLSNAPRRPKSAFDTRLPSQDGLLARVVFDAKKLLALQMGLEFDNSSEKVEAVDSQAGRVALLIHEADAHYEPATSYTTAADSLQTRILRRNASVKLYKKGLCPLSPSPTVSNGEVIVLPDQSIHETFSFESAARDMATLATGLMQDFKPGTAIVHSQAIEEDRDAFRDTFEMAMGHAADNLKAVEEDFVDSEEQKGLAGQPIEKLVIGNVSGQGSDEPFVFVTVPSFLVKYIALGVYIRGDFQEMDKFRPSPNLETVLRPWQQEGAELLSHMLNGPLRGAVLGDGMGLGKTLTSINVTLRDPNEPYEGPVLVVAPKAVQSTWLDELSFHFQQLKGPRVFVLKGRNVSAAEIFGNKYDFIIVSYNYVVGASQDLDFAENTAQILNIERSQRRMAKGIVLPVKYRRPWRVGFPLCAETMDAFGLQFPIIVLDEAHKVKNHSSETHIAIRNLKYSKVLAVSGTAFPNKWHDIYGMIDFLPGNPFESFDHFVKCFSTLINGRPGNTCETDEILAFLDSFFVARPQSVMSLRGLEEHLVEAPLSTGKSISIALLADEFYRLARMRSDNDEDNDTTAAFAKAVEAETLAISDLLSREDREEDTKPYEDWCEKKGIVPADVSPDQLLEWVERAGRRPKLKRKPRKGRKTAPKSTRASLDGDNSDDPDFVAGQTEYHEDDGNDEMEENDEEYCEEQTKGRGGPKRALWLTRLRQTPPSEFVNEPRIKAVTDTVARVLSDNASDKILIFSKYLTVLDIIERALEEAEKDDAIGVRVLRFDGSMSHAKRDKVRHEVQSNSTTPCVILLTAGAGGVGLTLTAANHVILCEYWWTQSEELQALSRCYRQGQEKTVHVWRVRSLNSAIELYVQRTAKAKATVTGDIAKWLVRDLAWNSIVEFNRDPGFFCRKSHLGSLAYADFTRDADKPEVH